MGTTWRERIAEAEQRGRFTPADIAAWEDAETCLVGEQRQRYGLHFSLDMRLNVSDTALNATEILPGAWSADIQTMLANCLAHNDIAGVSRLYDAIADRAFQLSQEANALSPLSYALSPLSA